MVQITKMNINLMQSYDKNYAPPCGEWRQPVMAIEINFGLR